MAKMVMVHAIVTQIVAVMEMGLTVIAMEIVIFKMEI